MDQPTIPWYKSQVLWGLLISIVLKLSWAVFKWKPPVDIDTADVVREICILASFVGDAIAAHGRITATAQPVTLTDQNG